MQALQSIFPFKFKFMFYLCNAKANMHYICRKQETDGKDQVQRIAIYP